MLPRCPAFSVRPSITLCHEKAEHVETVYREAAGEATVGAQCDSHSTHCNSTSGSARAANVTNLIIGLNLTSPTAPQLEPPPVPLLYLQSTLRCRIGAHPELVALSQPRRRVSPTSMRSGRPLTSSSSSTTSSSWQKLDVGHQCADEHIYGVQRSEYALSTNLSHLGLCPICVVEHQLAQFPEPHLPSFLEPGFFCSFE